MRPPAPGVSSRCNSRGASRTASSIFTHVALLAGRDVRSAPPAKKLRRHLLLVQFSSVRVRFLELIEQQWPLASSGASSAWILRPRRAHVTRASRAWRWRGGWRSAEWRGTVGSRVQLEPSGPAEAPGSDGMLEHVLSSSPHGRTTLPRVRGYIALARTAPWPLVLPYGLAVLWHTSICAASMLLACMDSPMGFLQTCHLRACSIFYPNPYGLTEIEGVLISSKSKFLPIHINPL